MADIICETFRRDNHNISMIWYPAMRFIIQYIFLSATANQLMVVWLNSLSWFYCSEFKIFPYMLSREWEDLHGALCKMKTCFVNPLFGYVVTMIEGVYFLIGVSLSHHTSATPGGAIVYLFALQTIPFFQVHDFSLFLTCTSSLWELRTDFPFFIEP